MAQHILEVLVENSPGVLARVAGLFARRGYNIEKLNVSPTSDLDVSQMDIVISVEGHALDQVIAQLDKLINVISIKEIKNNTSPEIHDTQPDYQN
jgi:acetolactate synthase small subunit